MGKSCSCMQFIKILKKIFSTSHVLQEFVLFFTTSHVLQEFVSMLQVTRESYQVVQVTCGVSERAMIYV